jgi:hypothetical protein
MLKTVLSQFDPEKYPAGGSAPVAMIKLHGQIGAVVVGNVHNPNPVVPAALTQKGEYLRIEAHAYAVPSGSPEVVMPALIEIGAKAAALILMTHPGYKFNILHVLYGAPKMTADGRFIVYFGFGMEKEE